MTDNLEAMVNDYVDGNDNTPSQTEVNSDLQTTTEQTNVTKESINLITLTDWLTKYKDDLNQINISKVSPKREGVIIDNSKNALLMVKESDSENDMRELYLVKDANKIKVPDMKPSKVKFFSNDSFKIIFEYGQSNSLQEGDENFYIKSYVTKSNMTCSYCVRITATDQGDGAIEARTRNMLVPYYSIKTKRNDTKIPYVVSPVNIITDILIKNVDIEAIILQYKQASKIGESLKTNIEVIDWLIKRQEIAVDINHQLLIDKIILDIINS